MPPLDTFYSDYLWLIQRLREDLLYKPDLTNRIVFRPVSDAKAPSCQRQIMLLEKLHSWNFFQYFSESNADVFEIEIDDKEFIKKSLLIQKRIQDLLNGKKYSTVSVNEREVTKIIQEGLNFNDIAVTARGTVDFDDNEAILLFNGKQCPLPPFKNEHFLCRTIYNYPIDEYLSWDIAYEELTGYNKVKNAIKNTAQAKRTIYDTIEQLNKRVFEIFKIKDWIHWENKSLKRTK